MSKKQTTIKQRGTSYEVSFYLGETRMRKSFKTEAEALSFSKGLGTSTDPQPNLKPLMTFGEAIRSVEVEVWSQIKDYKNTMNRAEQVKEYFKADTLVRLITSGDISKFKAHCKRLGNSQGTINRKLSIVSQTLRWAYDNEHLDRLPSIKRETENGKRERILTADEIKKIVRFFKSEGEHESADFFLVAVLTGLRITDQLNLTVANVKGDTLRLATSKNGKPYSVPLVGEALPIIKKRVREAQQNDGRLFSLTDSQYRYRWDRMRDILELGSDAVRYITRHSCATHLLMNGVDIYTVKEVLNHSSVTVTQKYSHLASSHIAERMKAIETLGVG